MKTKFLLLLLLFISVDCFATTYKVGITRTYESPNALYVADVLQSGDTIEIDTELYVGIAALAVWQPDNLVIKGVGGRPQLNADGEYILGKGIWVLAGDNITVEQMEFSGASVPDHNGAGIRLDGTGLTVRHCYFHNNENGILTSNPYSGDILIEYSEFDNNGFGDGFSHNLYIGHVDRLTFRYNYVHHAKIGHNIKSRAKGNYILYNRIMDEEEGTSSRLIDLANGGFSIIMGNLLMQGNNALNNNFIGYGLEGVPDAVLNDLYVVNNTFVNKRNASCLFLDLSVGTMSATVANNIFAGSENVHNNAIAVLDNNLIVTDIEEVLFLDELNYDYHLQANSPAIDLGTELPPVGGYNLTPGFVYLHPANAETRTTNNALIDAGAYEFTTPTSTTDFTALNLLMYPNPVTNILSIRGNTVLIEEVQIFNALGRVVITVHDTDTVDCRGLGDGMYFVWVVMNGKRGLVGRIVK